MDVVEALRVLGGFASRGTLIRLAGRAEVDRAVRHGRVTVAARGRYALPEVGTALGLAHAHSGVLSLTSAALHHGWEVKEVPPLPHITFPRKRRRSASGDLVAHYRNLAPEDVVDGIATGVEVTLDQCLRLLPFDEALVVADSALRHDVPPSTLRRVAAAARGSGAVQLRRVVALADGDAANPFESVLRAIASTVPGLTAVPQVLISTEGGWFRPDLVDRDLGMVMEADSFAWHSSKRALQRDAARYNALVVEGWLVLRFSWVDVMHHPELVRRTLVRAVHLVAGQARCRHGCDGPA